jgi:hypothetical protein
MRGKTMNSNTIRRWGVAVAFVGMMAATVYGLAGAAHADPSATPDPSDTPCYQGSLYCPPPLYSRGSVDQGPPCVYVLGRWADQYGNRCASGAAYVGGRR